MASIAHFRQVLKGQVQVGPTAFTEYWTALDIERSCRDCRHAWRDRFRTPLRTLWAFLLQVLHEGSSCREAVALALGGQAAAGSLPPRPAYPSAYSVPDVAGRRPPRPPPAPAELRGNRGPAQGAGAVSVVVRGDPARPRTLQPAAAVDGPRPRAGSAQPRGTACRQTPTQGIRPPQPPPRRNAKSPCAEMSYGFSSCHSEASLIALLRTWPGMLVGTRSGHVSCVERDLVPRLLYRDSI